MNAENPSRRTQHNEHTSSGAAKRRAPQSGNQAAYETPTGAEHRTFEFAVSSLYETWLLASFTGWAGERLWTDATGTPFEPIRIKVTFRESSIELPELRWLAEYAFALDDVPFRAPYSDGHRHQGRPLRASALRTVARQVHRYLTDYDIAALLDRIGDVPQAVRHDIVSQSIPSEELVEAFAQHLRTCMRCVQLTYFTDDFGIPRRKPSELAATDAVCGDEDA